MKDIDLFDAQQGKKPYQKLKPYVVFQYLLKYSDENNPHPASEIVDFLDECGISAERRSIYRDIDDINKIALMFDEQCSIQKAEEMLSNDEDDELKLVIYDKSRKGFYVRQRNYDINDIRLLAECVYSAKFLPQSQSERLTNIVCNFVSKQQANKIKHSALLTDRVRTQNKSILSNISIINDAMSKTLDGQPHVPEKITFQYMRYSIDNMNQQVARRNGDKYIVSPFKLLINDSNYYLLAFDDKKKKMITYRVDRMKGVSFTGVPREGDDAYRQIDFSTYTKRVFSMFSGKEELVVIRFINHLLDTVVDRFGKQMVDVQYESIDDKHFTITTHVEISEQFFGWVLGFGKRAKIIGSESVVKQFEAYIDKIKEMYK